MCCALTAILSLLLVAALAVDAAGLFAEMHRRNPELADQGVADSTLESVTWTSPSAAWCGLWCPGCWPCWPSNRMRWAGIALIVSAGSVALLCLAGSLVSPPLAVPGVLAAATAGLLLQPTSQRWLARGVARRRRRPAA